MRLAIGRAAGHGGADAGRQMRIQKIDVEADMQHAVAGFHLVDHPSHQYPDTEPVDLAHVGDADAASPEQIFFKLVDRADPEQLQLIGADGGARLDAQKTIEPGSAATETR